MNKDVYIPKGEAKENGPMERVLIDVRECIAEKTP
jgi:hypothetical protein